MGEDGFACGKTVGDIRERQGPEASSVVLWRPASLLQYCPFDALVLQLHVQQQLLGSTLDFP